VHETEVSVLSGLRLWGVRITGVELTNSIVYYTLAESNVTARAS
jgi:hypothetical protein